jgi:hypothetical protein
MPQIQLVGGELDGMELSIASVTPRPDIYYAVPLLDEAVVRATKGSKARATLRRKLGILAYVYDSTVRKEKVGWEYQYIRCPDKDRAAPLDIFDEDASEG